MSDLLHYETEIVWLEDPATLPYVRETVMLTANRTKPPRLRGMCKRRLVGYACLSPEIRHERVPGMYRRRIFWLKDHDRDREPNGVFARRVPGEAVDPRKVRAGVPSERLRSEDFIYQPVKEAQDDFA